MLEYVIVFLITGIAACYLIARFGFRKNAGCGCDGDSSDVCAIDRDKPLTCQKNDNSMKCGCDHTH